LIPGSEALYASEVVKASFSGKKRFIWRRSLAYASGFLLGCRAMPSRLRCRAVVVRWMPSSVRLAF